MSRQQAMTQHDRLRALTENRLSLREKLAQLLFVRVGSNLPPVCTVEDDAERIGELLSAYPLGGLIVFNGQRDHTARTLERLQRLAKYPLLVGADIERGIGQQIRGYTLFPHAMAFDALGDEAEEQVYEFARLTGIAARAHGIHLTFSPVADVNVDPRNPIIATRAFGDEPHRVARLVAAFVKGSAAGGVLCTAKHFPGHGNTSEDSHHTLPIVTGSSDELEACELAPFRAAIAAGVPILMTAHVQFPGWDASGKPATLSPVILQDRLRGELGFNGAVASDSMLMEGVKSRDTTEGELVLQALLAGVDLQLDAADVAGVLETLEHAVAGGRLPLTRVDEALLRVLRLKETVFAGMPPEWPLAQVLAASDELATRVARSSIRTLSAQRALTPFVKDKSLAVVMLRPHQSHLDPIELPLGDALRERFSQCDYRELTPSATADDYAAARARLLTTEQAVVVMVVKPAAWYRFGLLPEQDAFVRDITTQRACVVASLGTPVALADYASATERVCAYSDVFVSQTALADYLCGQGARSQ